VPAHLDRHAVSFLFLTSFIAGLLLAVRLMFFGAEGRRRRTPDVLQLRRSEPALIAFLVMFGVSGYLATRHGALAPLPGALVAAVGAVVFAAIVTWLAIATARIKPAHDPEDPRYLMQGHVGVVTAAIPADGEGMIRFDEENGAATSSRARDIGSGAIAVGEEVCIERIEDGVAYVELWALVEERL
jgi:hypothetical protein